MKYSLNVLVQVFQEADDKIGLIMKEIDYGSHPQGKRGSGEWGSHPIMLQVLLPQKRKRRIE